MIKIMHIDDSAVVRQVMAEIFNKNTLYSIESAADPIFALRRMEKNWPDVIILDIEMPRMDGITFLKKIMLERPTPVVMCSSHTTKGAKLSIEALSLGAVDIITKPKADIKPTLIASNKMIIDAICSASKIKYTNANNRNVLSISHYSSDSSLNNASSNRFISRKKLSKNNNPSLFSLSKKDLSITQHLSEGQKIIAIGASTGGTIALEKILINLPVSSPGIVVVQHMPEKFTKAFAARLNEVCDIDVCEGVDGQKILSGQAIISPGGKHLTIFRRQQDYYIQVKDGPLVNRHKPSVDVLFRSVAKYADKKTLGIILTGMGADGAKGLKEIKEAGGETMGQDEQSSVVYGMPFEAFKIGAVNKQVSLQDISQEIVKFYKI